MRGLVGQALSPAIPKSAETGELAGETACPTKTGVSRGGSTYWRTRVTKSTGTAVVAVSS